MVLPRVDLPQPLSPTRPKVSQPGPKTDTIDSAQCPRHTFGKAAHDRKVLGQVFDLKYGFHDLLLRERDGTVPNDPETPRRLRGAPDCTLAWPGHTGYGSGSPGVARRGAARCQEYREWYHAAAQGDCRAAAAYRDERDGQTVMLSGPLRLPARHTSPRRGHTAWRPLPGHG